MTLNEAGSGFEPSSSAPSRKAFGFLSFATPSASPFEMNSTDFTFAVSSIAARRSARSSSVADSLM